MPRVAKDYVTASRASYNKFIENHPKSGVTYKEFKDILYTYFGLLSEHILLTGDMVSLPFGLGDFTINKKRPKNYIDKEGNVKPTKSIDWKATNEVGKRVYHKNYHTDGYKFRWAWFPFKSHFRLNKLWSFKASRENSRWLARILKTPNNKQQHLYKNWFK